MKRILVVDDSATLRLALTLTLQGAGYEVVAATDGQDALAKAAAAPAHLVLTDLYMPRLDGLGLIRALRALADYRFVPIVLLTTEGDAAKKQEARAAGASGWIAKPFQPEQLLAVVKKVLG